MIALATKEYDSTQRESSEEEMGLNEQYDSPEIVEQSALNHFNFVLKEAQRVVAQAENKRPQMHPKRYNGKSKRTLEQHKNYWNKLAQQGFLSVFEFMAHTKETARKKAHLDELTAKAIEVGPESEESGPELEKSGSELEESMPVELILEHMSQVHHSEVLIS